MNKVYNFINFFIDLLFNLSISIIIIIYLGIYINNDIFHINFKLYKIINK